MKRLAYGVILVVAAAFLFKAGSWYGGRARTDGGAGDRKVLYYVDPMNPAHTSSGPGLAPCGMKMEPVYANSRNGEGAGMPDSLPPGAIRVSPERQQLIGVRTARAEMGSEKYRVRTVGTVAADEARIYVINTATEGWIQDVQSPTTGSLVQSDELLGTFYSREFLSAEQSYFYALNTVERYDEARESIEEGGEGEQLSGAASPGQLILTQNQVQDAIENLETLGMGKTQIQALSKSRQYTQYVEIRSPAKAFILRRNASPGQRFDRGVELYKLADLDRVWVLADLFENEAQYARPGSMVRVTLPHLGKTYPARVSEVLPQFDPLSRSLKVRLEVDNPEYLLRPDMFVDVDFEADLPTALIVPVDAVLDAGVKKTVFVDLGNGYFEPRTVETGWRLGDRVQITAGLMAGENIVVSGNFLLDSETRMKRSAPGARVETSRCPVCGMDVDEKTARAAGRTVERGGKTLFFCSDECRKAFGEKKPEKPMEPMPAMQPQHEDGHPGGETHAGMPMGSMPGVVPGCPVCGMPTSIPGVPAGNWLATFGGKTYRFCSDVCKKRFLANPVQFLEERHTAHHAAEAARVGIGRVGHD